MRTSFLTALTGLALAAATAIGVAQTASPVVYTAEIDGIIHPIATAYIRGAVEKADAAGASLLVITLRTPGGLVDSTRDINTAIIQARTPVAIFVGPAGGRAASAGFLITMAADVAAMAPGTHIGAAHPVSGIGERLDQTMAKKVASDVAGYARTLATQRRRNVSLVEQAVIDSRTFTEQEAIGAAPPLIDLIANDVPDLLRKLDGRTIRRFDGRSETLHTASASTHAVAMTWSQQLLSAVAHPQIAYLLLLVGIAGLGFELFNPGAVVPGVAGGISLLMAFFAFQVLPVSSAGVLLILLGLALLVLEVKLPSYGSLAVGGIAALFFGSMMLIDSPQPELQIGLRLIAPVTIGLSAIILFLVGLVLRTRRTPPMTGAAAMLDEIGRALTPLAPGVVGRVQTHGEIWSATSEQSVAAGDAVRVTGVHGLTLTVRKG